MIVPECGGVYQRRRPNSSHPDHPVPSGESLPPVSAPGAGQSPHAGFRNLYFPGGTGAVVVGVRKTPPHGPGARSVASVGDCRRMTPFSPGSKSIAFSRLFGTRHV